MPLTRLYRDGKIAAQGFPIAEVSDHLADPACTVWFDLLRPTPDDLHSVSEELGLHPLAVEDALTEHQRPKIDRYASHLFVTAYAVRLDVETGELTKTTVNAFVTPNALVTIRPDESFDINEVTSRWDLLPALAKHGVAYLLHGLIDYVVDTLSDASEALDEQIEDLEDALFDDRPTQSRDMQRRTYELRKSLVRLRHVVVPTQELVDGLRREGRAFDDAMEPYYEDVYDHARRAVERADTLRELVSTILETQLTLRGNRLNVIMKQVTSWAAIIAVPTAVTGFYGQNVPYPGFGSLWGFILSSSIIAVLSVSLYLLFRRRDWL
ncbi:magnesium transporter [Hamadaea flava]|uniref:Magnesium transporter CorA family protein n=1 Tax=Hamadaea flava TaxID=1742688 RepID=A0ABV8LXP2_9ACTN|nr:magnesium transporter CorA family protein [Hamadaea flava]MCP2329165.1 magnesium transporter [Hamadaea flava]